MKQNKGITLVALVVTIIILLILAGISIQALTQTNLFTQAKRAKNATENAQREENKILSEYINEMNEYSYEKLIDIVEIGDYVDYNATNQYSYTSMQGNGKSNGNGAEDQTYKSSSEIKWRVFSKNKEKNELILISEEPIGNLTLNGSVGYLYAEEELNHICKIYGYGLGADNTKTFNYEIGDKIEGVIKKENTGSGARSLSVEDINDKLNYKVNNPTNPYTKSIYFPSLDTETGYSISTKERNDKTTYYIYSSLDYIDTTSILYKMLFKNVQNTENLSFFLASRCERSDPTLTHFGIHNINNNNIDSNSLGYGSGNEFHSYKLTMGIRPIVYLNSELRTKGKDENGIYRILEQ